MRVSFVVWGTEEKLVFCVCSIRFIRVDHPMNEYLKHLDATRNTRASAAVGELALVIPFCRTDQFSPSFLSGGVRLCNVLPSGVFSGGTLGFF